MEQVSSICYWFQCIQFPLDMGNWFSKYSAGTWIKEMDSLWRDHNHHQRFWGDVLTEDFPFCPWSWSLQYSALLRWQEAVNAGLQLVTRSFVRESLKNKVAEVGSWYILPLLKHHQIVTSFFTLIYGTVEPQAFVWQSDGSTVMWAGRLELSIRNELPQYQSRC